MITQVTASNKSRYQKLWEDATNDLKIYDANGEIAELAGTDPVITERIDSYAKVKVTVDTYTPGEFYYISGYDEDAPVYTLDEGEFTEGRDYFMQYDGAEISSLNEYFGYIEELAAINAAKYTRLPLDENYFEINANSRTVTIPDDFAKNGVSVAGDLIAEILYFRVNRYFDMDDFGSDKKSIFVEWTNANGRSGISKAYTVDVDSEPGYVIFGWPIDAAITETQGKVQFSVRIYQVDENKALEYSWATVPATVEIKNSLNFDISALLAENDAEIIRRNDELILNRLTNSVVSDTGEAEAAAPIFYDRAEVNGEATNFGDLPATFDMSDEQGADNKLYAAAYSTDEGTVSYRWVKTTYAPTGYLKITLSQDDYKVGTYYVKTEDGEYVLANGGFEEGTTYYVAQYGTDGFDDGAVQKLVKVPTLDELREENKTYFGQTSQEGKKPITYKLYTGEILDGVMVDDEGFTSNIVYENATCALPNGVGRYRVVATNRSGKSTAATNSTTCIIAPPDKPIIAAPVETTSAILEANKDYKTTIKLTMTDPARKLTKTTYQWMFKAPNADEFSEVEGETKAVLDIAGGVYDADAVGKGDGFYKAVVTNAINGATAEVESIEWVVTHEPAILKFNTALAGADDNIIDVVADTSVGGNVSLDEVEVAFTSGLPVQELAMKEALGIENEGISYDWYKFYNSGKDFEEIAQKAYDGLLTEPTVSDKLLDCHDKKLSRDLIESNKRYYCIITNSYNGQEVKCSSPLFSVEEF